MPIETTTTLAKWGNRTGIHNPKTVADLDGLHEGDEVRVQVEAPAVIVVRLIRATLAGESCFSDHAWNRHAEADWDHSKTAKSDQVKSIDWKLLR